MGQCTAMTRAGNRCRRLAADDDVDTCFQHARRLRLISGGGGDHPDGPAKTVKEAAGRSRRELLTALRDRIAADIDDGVPARDLASLSKRLLDISKELDDVAAAEDGDDITAAAATPDEAWSG